ncbi:hypothetical protein D3C87_279590 [compost metagenome]
MFFQVDEKTIAEMIKNQQAREKARAESAGIDYKGHKLTFAMSIDNHTVILSEPPLITIKAVKDQAGEGPSGPVDVLTPSGWKRKEN